jgi:hypothetical protein
LALDKITRADLGCGGHIHALHDVPEACALMALFVQFTPVIYDGARTAMGDLFSRGVELIALMRLAPIQ